MYSLIFTISPTCNGRLTDKKIPDMKFAAISWNANASANPIMPAPAKREVTALSSLRILKEIKTTIPHKKM